MSGIELTINGARVNAKAGQSVLAAGEAAGIRMPRNENGVCMADQFCEACRVRINSGVVDPHGSALGTTVLGCRATCVGPAAISFQPFPRELKSGAEILAVNALGSDILELVLRAEKPIPYLPGQHIQLTIGKLQPRALTPTLSLDGLRELDTLHFHVRRRHGGLFGHQLEPQLRAGQRVKLAGPYGHGFLRQGEGRLVLVSSSTGFAAIWSIAVAARLGQPHRPLHIVASAHDPRNLYMRPALEWLVRQGVNDITLAASGAHPLPPARFGRASSHLPALSASDTVHVAGHPGLVEAVMSQAAQAGATVFGIPHLPTPVQPGMVERLSRYFGTSAKPRNRVEPPSDLPPVEPPLPEGIRRIGKI
ncbi:UbiB 2-polyprenylphenol hydroxylase and related flavodoxin oxidoreductases [Rhabdaerophilaceae bacterium]